MAAVSQLQAEYFPWHLTPDEARFLTLVLRQSIDVALRFKENRKLLPRSADDLFLVRVPTKSEDGILWEDGLLKPEPKEDRPATDEAIDELRIARIRKSATGKAGIWETDFVMAPMSVRDDDRPYFPFLMMVVDHRSYMILHNDMSSPWEYKSALPEGFLKFLERIKVFPSELRASRKETFDLLRPITDSLGIKFTLTDDTEALDSACSALFGYFGGR